MKPTIILSGVSKKGKDLIKAHGEEWNLIDAAAQPPIFNGDAGIFIWPMDKGSESGRWIRQMGDRDFQVISIERND